jgi:hypothetical protein
MIKLFLSFIFFLCLLSCETRRTQEVEIKGTTVDWSQLNERSKPSIDARGRQTYGPVSIEEDVNKDQVQKDINGSQAVALIFGAGLYRSMALISFLKELEVNQKFEARVIMGHGMSATIAAYYAFGRKPDYIEWKFFQFLRKTSNVKILSKEWKDIFEELLLGDFKNKRIEDSKLTLLVPIFNHQNKSVSYLKRGSLVEALLSNVNVVDFDKDGPAFMHNFLTSKKVRVLGVSKIITLDLVSQGITWKSGSGYYNGLYEKAASQFNKLKSQDTKIESIIYPLQDYALDDSSLVSKFIFESQSYSKEQLKRISIKAKM